MCWTTRIGIGNVAGMPASTAASACGPPVEAQMPITEALRDQEAGALRWFRRARGCLITLTPLSSLTRWRRAWAAAPSGSARSNSAFGSASSAPAASAWSAVCERRSTCPESTRIGTGKTLMICSIASTPDMPGSSRSIVTRSGFSVGRRAIACSAVSHTPTTSISGSRSSSRESPTAYVLESSQMRTRRTRAGALLTARRAARRSRAGPAGRTPASPCRRRRRPRSRADGLRPRRAR